MGLFTLRSVTYIPTDEGWLYLAVVLDLYSRKIDGWAMNHSLDAELVAQALYMALVTRQPAAGLLHHSDRGAQYASGAYQTLLHAWHIDVSMSRAANCYDNAPMESFFGTLKTESLDQPAFASQADARQSVFSYIEGFYNRRRRHSSLGYLSPEEFERRHALGL